VSLVTTQPEALMASAVPATAKGKHDDEQLVICRLAGLMLGRKSWNA
jgi:hypothetical protein